jgi:hypothetical protein
MARDGQSAPCRREDREDARTRPIGAARPSQKGDKSNYALAIRVETRCLFAVRVIGLIPSFNLAALLALPAWPRRGRHRVPAGGRGRR